MRPLITRLRLPFGTRMICGAAISLPEQCTTARERARNGNSFGTTDLSAGSLLKAVPPQSVARTTKTLTRRNTSCPLHADEEYHNMVYHVALRCLSILIHHLSNFIRPRAAPQSSSLTASAQWVQARRYNTPSPYGSETPRSSGGGPLSD